MEFNGSKVSTGADVGEIQRGRRVTRGFRLAQTAKPGG
jgi:hypothetical protein